MWQSLDLLYASRIAQARGYHTFEGYSSIIYLLPVISNLPMRIRCDTWSWTEYSKADWQNRICRCRIYIVQHQAKLDCAWCWGSIAWDWLLSTTGSLAVTFGAEQPFRYRGYCLHRQSPDLRTKKRAGNICKAATATQRLAASSPQTSLFPPVRVFWGITLMRYCRGYRLRWGRR